MREINRSICFKNYPPKLTKIVAGKRVCRFNKESKPRDLVGSK